MLDIAKFEANKMILNTDSTTVNRKDIFFLKGLRLQYWFVILEEDAS